VGDALQGVEFDQRRTDRLRERITAAWNELVQRVADNTVRQSSSSSAPIASEGHNVAHRWSRLMTFFQSSACALCRRFYRAAAMQTRSSYQRLSLCLSVRPSVYCDKTKKHLAKRVQLSLIGSRLHAFQQRRQVALGSFSRKMAWFTFLWNFVIFFRPTTGWAQKPDHF